MGLLTTAQDQGLGRFDPNTSRIPGVVYCVLNNCKKNPVPRIPNRQRLLPRIPDAVRGSGPAADATAEHS
jgi:hypothetical protein